MDSEEENEETQLAKALALSLSDADGFVASTVQGCPALNGYPEWMSLQTIEPGLYFRTLPGPIMDPKVRPQMAPKGSRSGPGRGTGTRTGTRGTSDRAGPGRGTGTGHGPGRVGREIGTSGVMRNSDQRC